jgi:hypothetical protein
MSQHIGRYALRASVLIVFSALVSIGPMSACGVAATLPTLPEATQIVEHDVGGITALQEAYAIANPKSPACWTAIRTGESHTNDAFHASLSAEWPTELSSIQNTVNKQLTTVALKLVKLQSPRRQPRTTDIKSVLSDCTKRLKTVKKVLDPIAVQASEPVQPPPPRLTPTTTASSFTWTDLQPSADSRIVYVSSSEGSDANDGLSSATPKATWWGPSGAQSLIRPGYPDWMLLKRGDVWTEVIDAHYISLQGGRSASEKMVLSSYGTSTARPHVRSTQVRVWGAGERSHVAIVGIHLERLTESLGTYDPNNYNYPVGITIQPNHGTDFLVEDCLVEKYAINVEVHPSDETYDSVTDVRIRGNVLVDAYASGAVHAQGIYAQNVDGILVEGNVLDHNGWSETVPDAGMTIFNHNIYVNQNCANFTFRQNITSRASAQGMPSGICKLNEDNLYLSNPFSCNVFNTAPQAVVRYNVFIDGANVRGPALDGGAGAQEGGTGIQASYYGTGPAFAGHTIEIYGNILANQVSGTGWGPFGIQIGGPASGLSIRDNILYKWNRPLYPSDNVTVSGTNDVTNNVFVVGPATGELLFYSISNLINFSAWHLDGNQWYSESPSPWWYIHDYPVASSTAWIAATGETNGVYTQPSFPDPTRSPASYNASLGGTPTLEGFLSEARKQSRLNWRPEYTAVQAGNYFRAGFGRAAR